MNKIPNRQAICETLMEHAKADRDIVVLCSDSRGSASLTPFFNAFPEQSINGKILNGHEDMTPVTGLAVLVDGETIAGVIPDGEVSAEYTAVDLRDGYLMPFFADDSRMMVENLDPLAFILHPYMVSAYLRHFPLARDIVPV